MTAESTKQKMSTLRQVHLLPMQPLPTNSEEIIIQRKPDEPTIMYSQIITAIKDKMLKPNDCIQIFLYRRESVLLPNQSTHVEVDMCFEESHMCLLQGSDATIWYEIANTKKQSIKGELKIDENMLVSKDDWWDEMWYELCSARMLHLVPGMFTVLLTIGCCMQIEVCA